MLRLPYVGVPNDLNLTFYGGFPGIFEELVC